MNLDFTSDNATGASPEIMKAIVAANDGTAPAYGADEWSRRAEQALAQVFEREIAVFLVATGTAANALAISALVQPWGAALCHGFAHVAADECGAPEFFAGGAKLASVAGAAGKITPQTLADTLELMPRGIVKQAQPMALSLAQATECGSAYSLAEIAALSDMAHAAALGVHMDGARFANALVTLGCSPADMSWRAGVDVLSFGATKNGALACEAVIFFDPAKAEDFAYRRKRGGHTLSKGRLLGCQMLAYLEDGRWLRTAAHANLMAARLEAGLRGLAGVRLPWAREANEVFAIVPRAAHDRLQKEGARYHVWTPRALEREARPNAGEVFVRLISSFATQPAAIDRFVAVAGGG
ncbi:MAG: low specificity L-threonine aldolase [Hyphomicrobiales bacterium]|nr:low specificity L-threonine aldolase [Hyphomicrobiales bacterium]